VAFAALALGVSPILAFGSYELSRRYLVDQRVSSAVNQAYLNARLTRVSLRTGGPGAPATNDVRTLLGALQTSRNGAAVVRVGGQWFGTAVGVGRERIPASLRDDVAAGAVAHQLTSVRGVPQVAVGVPLPSIDVLYFEFVPLDELDRTLAALARALAVGAAVTTLVGAALGLYASGRVLRPVRRMALAAGNIGEGALDRRLDAEGDSDLEPLVVSFNDMVASLEARVEREAQFASDVSHEMRAPLAAMTSALNVAKRRVADPAAVDALDVLREEIDGFTRLVLDLLEISRVQAGVATLQLEMTDPGELVREVLASSHRDVPVDVAPSTPGAVVVDRRRVGQVLTNLVDNAALYGGGATAVRLWGDDGHVCIAVDDAGPGVPPHEREYVFERFARGTSSGKPGAPPGSGLGLALSAGHVALHGGRISVGDAPEGGARFLVELPAEQS
jgi:signal transduction histidine kinase